MEKKKTRIVKIGNLFIGGGNPIAIQSMLSKRPEDIEGNIQQAVELEQAGCDIVRVAIPNREAIALIPAIKKAVSTPLVADIHFDYQLALAAVEAGVDKIRINPGNIGTPERIKEVTGACKQCGIPIRIGVNSGSLEKEILDRYQHPTAEALAESALYHISLLEQFSFYDIVVAVKSSDVPTMIQAYRLLAERCDYPLHLGVTEAGTETMGTLKSAIGIGSLLCDGIGDTIRVSLSADPVKEIYAAKNILSAVGMQSKTGQARLIACPTCGRTNIDLIGLANQIEERLKNVSKEITVAVMGCIVNGPGEAREADIGIAGGNGEALLFKKGVPCYKVAETEIVEVLMKEIERMDC